MPGKKIDELTAEKWVRAWFSSQGFWIDDGDDTDFIVRNKLLEIAHVVEVKGDQANHKAYRNAFFTALGRAFVARACHPASMVAVAFTPGFKYQVRKHADVFKKHGLSLIWIRSENDIAFDDMSSWTNATHGRDAPPIRVGRCRLVPHGSSEGAVDNQRSVAVALSDI